MTRRRVSLIVPALDEAPRIADTLASLQRWRNEGHEVIVVDGGSGDGTLALAQPLADRALVAPRGRAAQMNAGAALARGDVLLFLHADSRLHEGALDALLSALGRSRRRWGRFDVALAGRSRWLPLIGACMNLRSRLTGIATGDQAIFVARDLFAAVDGFPLQPLMEDIELSRRLNKAGGRPLCLALKTTTSGRRWDEHGALRTISLMWRLRLAYALGAAPSKLAARYAAWPSPEEKHAARRPLPTLQIFAKAPVSGHVKTRLAAAIGHERAAAIHVSLTERTLRLAGAAREAGIVGRVELWCAPDAAHPAFAAWQAHCGATLEAQPPGDLGMRMRHALEQAISASGPTLLIGTDCPALALAHLARAAEALADHDAVFVPVEDGGYALVGLARPLDVFAGIAWSTGDVMAATRSRLVQQGARWVELPALWDVDVPADLARWQRHGGGDATSTPAAFAAAAD